METLDLSKRYVYWFTEIAKIPHGSCNEKALSDRIVQFAKDNNLSWKQDEIWNVIIEKPATEGCENAEPMILQAHIDMVNEKTMDSTHDFEKDPLDLYVEDGWLYAKDTTLGADDGKGAAYMLALLEDETAVHPALECIFTVQEEIGLDGAKALHKEDIHASRMISLDGGGEHQHHAPRAQRVDDEHRLAEQPVGVSQGGQSAEPGAGGEPARHAHLAQPDHGDGDEHRFGRNAEERVRVAQSTEFDDFRLPGLGDRRTGEHAVDVAPERLARMPRQLERLGGQHERGEQRRRRGDQHDQIRPLRSMPPSRKQAAPRNQRAGACHGRLGAGSGTGRGRRGLHCIVHCRPPCHTDTTRGVRHAVHQITMGV